MKKIQLNTRPLLSRLTAGGLRTMEVFVVTHIHPLADLHSVPYLLPYISINLRALASFPTTIRGRLSVAIIFGKLRTRKKSTNHNVASYIPLYKCKILCYVAPLTQYINQSGCCQDKRNIISLLQSESFLLRENPALVLPHAILHRVDGSCKLLYSETRDSNS